MLPPPPPPCPYPRAPAGSCDVPDGTVMRCNSTRIIAMIDKGLRRVFSPAAFAPFASMPVHNETGVCSRLYACQQGEPMPEPAGEGGRGREGRGRARRCGARRRGGQARACRPGAAGSGLLGSWPGALAALPVAGPARLLQAKTHWR